MFFFTAVDGSKLYMGADKFENEDLIKYGWPEDFWFHVDNLSSAHVYVRLAQKDAASARASGYTLDDLSEECIRDCAQLVKANSIEGSKKASVTVIYTPWSNLRKDGGMAAGQVSFHNPALVRHYVVLERDRDVLNRLAKTREESKPDLAKERERRFADERAANKLLQKEAAAAERALAESRRADKEARSYDRLFEGVGSTEDAIKAERDRMAALAAKALRGGGKGVGGATGGGVECDLVSALDGMGLGGGGGGGGGGKKGAARPRDEKAVAAAVRAIEEDFM